MGKKIPGDLYLRDNADQSLWIENRDFSYSRTFSLEQLPPVARLVFEGLYTYTDIYLNGAHVGSTEDMFIPHVFDVTSLMREGENEISVTFYSAIKRVEGLPLYPGAFTKERMNTRQMQCTYGWDWVARFVTCGIWRDVYLDCTQGFRIKDAYVYTDTAKKEYASIVAEVELPDQPGSPYYEACLAIKDSASGREYDKNEVKRDGKNHLYIDYKMRGLGSHSCGPLPEDEFEFKPHAFDFSFLIGAGLSDEELTAIKRADLGAVTGRREASDFSAEVGNTSTLL